VNRKIVFVTILGLSAIIVIAAALFLPSLAQSERALSVPSSDQNVPSVADSSQGADPTGTLVKTLYVYGGGVYLHLPPGGGALANRPTDLYIQAAFVYDATPNLAPVGDTMQVSVWCPTTNSYVQVTHITENNDPNFVAFANALYAGTPTSQNIFQFTSGGQLEVDR